MTQPNSVNMTFDTSLVDLHPNVSFSTTESDPSDIGTSTTSAKTSLLGDQSQETPKQSQTMTSAPPKSSTPVQHIGTQDAYDQWATVYDSDGNMLQAIDDIELSTLLPNFLNKVLDAVTDSTISLLDLGCGTGRNTANLLNFSLPPGRQSTVTGLDFSKGMLDIAAEKLRAFTNGPDTPRLKLTQCDCFPTVTEPSASPIPTVPNLHPVHAVLSTLVLEHVPLQPYFATLSSLLLPNGLALITNMHSEMGAKSQAGFINADGVKVRGSSFAHTLPATVAMAEQSGFEVLSVLERKMSREDVENGRVGERGWKWVGVRVWYGVVLRKR